MKGFVVLSFLSLLPVGVMTAASDSQTFTLDHKLQIPGATLKSGEYTFQVEDRLQDRAIIRITDTKKNSHELLLAVPNQKLTTSDRGKLLLFPDAGSDKQILQGWMCPSCDAPLEVVYPKAEAVKITGVSAKSVMAVDPTYDKLPKNLSADDMKVVTLWLLSPKEITADQKGKGVDGAKLADLKTPKTTETASAAPAEASPALAAPVAEPAAPAVAATDSQSTAVARATAPPSNQEATTNAPAAVPASPAPTTETTAVTSPAAPVAAPAPAASPVASPAATSSPDLHASADRPSRTMPHTASNTYTFGLIGFLLLSAGATLHYQRRLQSGAAKV